MSMRWLSSRPTDQLPSLRILAEHSTRQNSVNHNIKRNACTRFFFANKAFKRYSYVCDVCSLGITAGYKFAERSTTPIVPYLRQLLPPPLIIELDVPLDRLSLSTIHHCPILRHWSVDQLEEHPCLALTGAFLLLQFSQHLQVIKICTSFRHS